MAANHQVLLAPKSERSNLCLEPMPVVVGAGYAGVLCANRLARKTRAPVLLVAAQDSFLHRVRLHETAARGVSSELPLRPLLHPRIQLLRANAVGLDPAAKRLDVNDGERTRAIDYHQLVLALGSQLTPPFETGAPHAGALASHTRARAFSQALQSAADGACIQVIGGGLSAIELAAEVAEAHPRLRVRLLCQELAAHLPAAPRAALASALSRLRIDVVEQVSVRTLDESGAYDAHGSFWPSRLSVCATGFVPSVPDWLSTLPTSADGRLAVDHALRVLGFSDLFAIGDVAAPPASCIGRGLQSTRMGCVDAMPLAAHAADVIARGEAVPFHFNYPGQNISLGRRAGLTIFTDRDDQPSGRYVEGRVAALIKELVCRFVISALKLEAREWLGYAWLGMPSRTPAPELRLAP